MQKNNNLVEIFFSVYWQGREKMFDWAENSFKRKRSNTSSVISDKFTEPHCRIFTSHSLLKVAISVKTSFAGWKENSFSCVCQKEQYSQICFWEVSSAVRRMNFWKVFDIQSTLVNSGLRLIRMNENSFCDDQSNIIRLFPLLALFYSVLRDTN